jgi:hypothetical protein
MSRALFPLLLALCAAAQVSDFDKMMEAKVAELVRKNGPGTNPQLRARLEGMRKADQAVRKRAIDKPELAGEMEQVDRRLTAEMEEIVARDGWPTIRLVGLGASQAAALILNHSPDHAFQRTMLPELERLANEDQILRSDYAGIVDKVLVGEGKPQRFGNVYNFRDGKAFQAPVEDPARLDERRAKYLLPPMAEYKKMLADLYRVQVQ